MIELPDAPNEEDTERDGFLSYAVEWHALALGFLVGFAMAIPSKKLRAFAWKAVGLKNCEEGCRSDAIEEIQQEPHYAAGGVVFGALLGIVTQVTTLVVAIVASPLPESVAIGAAVGAAGALFVQVPTLVVAIVGGLPA